MFSTANRTPGLARGAALAAWLALAAVPLAAQRELGELRLEVHDPQGRPAAATGSLVSEANQVNREFVVSADGRYVAAELPFGVYRVRVAAEGFAEWTAL